MKDTKTGYSVQDNYFDDLKASIMTRVEGGAVAESVKISWGIALRRMGGFAAGFLLLVAATSAVYYFAAGKTQKAEIAMSEQEMLLLYSVDEDDILQIDEQFDSLDADVALAYVELYGYPTE